MCTEKGNQHIKKNTTAAETADTYNHTERRQSIGDAINTEGIVHTNGCNHLRVAVLLITGTEKSHELCC